MTIGDFESESGIEWREGEANWYFADNIAQYQVVDAERGYSRADKCTEEQAALHCSCCISDGHPDEECRLHGRFPWSGDWIGAKRVVISEYAPPSAIIATDTEIFVTQESWDTIYKWMTIKVDAARAVRRIVERELRAELAWLRKAGHDV